MEEDPVADGWWVLELRLGGECEDEEEEKERNGEVGVHFWFLGKNPTSY